MREQGLRIASSNVTFTVAYLKIPDNPELDGTICSGASAAIAFGLPPVISNVRARQRWPWNGLVDIEYGLSGDTYGMKTKIVFVEQGGKSRSWTATKFLAGFEPSAEPGHHRATWDSTSDGATNSVAEVKAVVKLVRGN